MADLRASQLFSVQGRVVVITGGGSGLGRVMARALGANGASKIFVLGRRDESLQETAARVPAIPVIPVQCDVTSKESLDAAYEAVAAQTTHVDLLFANSGTMGPMMRVPPPYPEGSAVPLEEVRDSLYNVPMQEFTKVLDVNVTGAYYTTLAFLPLLDAANRRRVPPQTGVLTSPSAQVVITSSIVGLLRQPTFSFAYNASKAATTHLVKMLSSTLSPYHIRVNGITPGLYHTEMSNYAFERLGVQGSGISEGSFSPGLIPLPRGGADQDFAGLIVWMASASGGYLNGAIMLTDGGWVGSVPAVYVVMYITIHKGAGGISISPTLVGENFPGMELFMRMEGASPLPVGPAECDVPWISQRPV